MKLLDICEAIVDCPHSTAKDEGSGYPLIRTPNVGKGRLKLAGVHRVPENVYNQRNERAIPQKDDLILAREAPVGNVAIIRQGQQVCLGQRTVLIRPNKEYVDPDFLVYYLLSPELQHKLLSSANGATVSHLNMSSIRSLEVQVPDIEIQKKVGAILARIDDKIEFNTAINENLLKQALCLYTEMIGSAPKNGSIGDYCAVKSGFAFKSKWWQDSGVPVVKIGSINQDHLNLLECSYVSKDKMSFAEDFIVSGGDLLIAMTGATIGKFAMVPKVKEPILVNQRVGKFFLGENPINRIPFIYCTLKQPEIISEVINRGQGSAQPNISASDIMSIPCIMPSGDMLDRFNKATSSMFELIINNQYQNQRLAALRDTLLPKLMNGEIDVSAVRI